MIHSNINSRNLIFYANKKVLDYIYIYIYEYYIGNLNCGVILGEKESRWSV